jgi:hypothetical protein
VTCGFISTFCDVETSNIGLRTSDFEQKEEERWYIGSLVDRHYTRFSLYNDFSYAAVQADWLGWLPSVQTSGQTRRDYIV